MHINGLCSFLKTLFFTLSTFLLISFIVFGLSACHSDSEENLQKSGILSYPHTAGLTPEVMKYAMNGYQWALDHHQVTNKNILTVVNFDLPSYEKRMWVIDLQSRKVLMALHVTQGKNSGAIYATRFSNRPGSLESSPGIFTTGEVYDGEHGRSMRVNGLEPGINDRAMERAIVIHPASYVTPSFIKENGYAGRSWGCFAVNPSRLNKLFRIIKNQSVLFAYGAPEKQDPRVNHSLSSEAQQVFDDILTRNQNIFSQYLSVLNKLIA